MKIGNLLLVGVGAWSYFRARDAKRLGVSIEDALLSPLTPLAKLRRTAPLPAPPPRPALEPPPRPR